MALKTSSSSKPGAGAKEPGGARSLWRIGGVFVALAVIVALPFLIWGQHFEAWLDQERLVGSFTRFRSTAWLAAICLLVSDIVLPIPNTMVMAALGAIYGPLVGGLISVAGNCLSGFVGYGLCRRFGRPLAVRLVGQSDLATAERFFARSGGWLVAVSRWLPVVPEAVSCMAGLARMKLHAFMLALLCGAVPLGFTVAGLGYAGSERPLLTLAACALLPLPLWLLLRRLDPTSA